MSIRIPDVSEFQGQVDWPRLGSDAAIVRLNYGDLHVDAQADRNIDGARSRCRVRGWYCYLIAGRAVEPQADTFCRILLAHDGLHPGEFIVCDDEEGAGDQSGRVDAFLDRCDAVLKTPDPGAEDWWYAGLNFAIAHDLAAARGHRWIAAYQAGEPTAIAHDLWQFTDAAAVAGIAGPVDCSVFHGSIDDLARLIGASAPPRITGEGMGNNIQLPDPKSEAGLFDVVLEEGSHRVWWGFRAGGEGEETSNDWVNPVPDAADGPMLIVPGTLSATVRAYQGVTRVTISGRREGTTEAWEIVLRGEAPWGVIQPWSGRALNVVIAAGVPGPKGDPGVDSSSKVTAALEAAVTVLKAP